MAMPQFKKISVNLTLIVYMVAFAGINNVQAENIKLPLSSENPEIRAVVDEMNANRDAVNNVVRETRDKTKITMSQRLPLMPQMRNTIGNEVSTRVMEETRRKTMNTQMEAMQDPTNPEGVPEIIAPKFDFE
jgi:predicted transcriptional regulator